MPSSRRIEVRDGLIRSLGVGRTRRPMPPLTASDVSPQAHAYVPPVSLPSPSRRPAMNCETARATTSWPTGVQC